ncbi:MAG: hypothetical protein K6G10_07035 [Butyrivibrio sp.]|nr:hypothetical protein [Butyrivibrio sp.]
MNKKFCCLLIACVVSALAMGCGHTNAKTSVISKKEAKQESSDPYENYLQKKELHKPETCFTINMDGYANGREYAYKVGEADRTVDYITESHSNDLSVVVITQMKLPKESGVYELGAVGDITDGYFGISGYADKEDNVTLEQDNGRYTVEYEFNKVAPDHKIRLYRYDDYYFDSTITFTSYTPGQKIKLISEENKLSITAEPDISADVIAYVPSDKPGTNVHYDMDLSDKPTAICGTKDMGFIMSQKDAQEEGFRVHIEAQNAPYNEVLYIPMGEKIPSPPDEIESDGVTYKRKTKWAIIENGTIPQKIDGNEERYKEWDFDTDTVKGNVRLVATFEVNYDKETD